MSQSAAMEDTIDRGERVARRKTTRRTTQLRSSTHRRPAPPHPTAHPHAPRLLFLSPSARAQRSLHRLLVYVPIKWTERVHFACDSVVAHSGRRNKKEHASIFPGLLYNIPCSNEKCGQCTPSLGRSLCDEISLTLLHTQLDSINSAI